MDDVFRLRQGRIPLVISFPHTGESLPPGLADRFTDDARMLDDTDWLLPQLNDFAEDIGASTIEPRYSRYVIDLNRPPDNRSLYPGQRGTALVPVEDFFGRAIYKPNQAPDASECAARLETYWQPYHSALAVELQRLKALHGHALLWDAHSIRNVVPTLFDGVLPDLNIGSADGASASDAVTTAMAEVASVTAFRKVVNGRFKGGYITRAYGAPLQQIHAVQLEMSKSLYLAPSFPVVFDANKKSIVANLLRQMVVAAMNAVPAPQAR
jgi:N-formylglutamate deformylase